MTLSIPMTMGRFLARSRPRMFGRRPAKPPFGPPMGPYRPANLCRPYYRHGEPLCARDRAVFKRRQGGQ